MRKEVKMSDWQDKLPPIAKEKLAKIEEMLVKERVLYFQAGITQEAFLRAVKEKTEKEKQPFLLAVYQTFDCFLEKEKEITGVTLACKKGCSLCCNNLLCCLEIEINEIIKFIDGLPRPARISLLRRIRNYLGEWRNYVRKNALDLEINPFKSVTDWARKPCVFLNEEGGHCEIYPVRLIDCRTTTSLIPCTLDMKIHIPCDLHYQGPGRFRFRSESWANNMILEEEGKRLGLTVPQQLPPVSPILHWLFIKKKELY